MKARVLAAFAFFAAAAASAASAAPTAVERGVVQFQRAIVFDQTLKTEGGDTLLKGPYEVRFESHPGNKVRATFFQGGVKRGEAQGIIIIGGTQAGPGGGPLTQRLMESVGMYYFFRHEDGKHHLVVGQQGANQIQISLLLPAVQPAPPPPQSRGRSIPPSPTSSPRKADVLGDLK